MTVTLPFDVLFKRYQDLLPLPHFTQKSLDEHFALLFTYRSNVLAGNELTLIETRVLLGHGVTAGGKRFTDHFDLVAHHEAMRYLGDCVQRSEPLTVKTICELHKRALRGANDKVTPGRFRTGSSSVGTHMPSAPEDLPSLVVGVLETYQTELKNADDKLPAIAKLHCDLVRLRPFWDGNGRLGRLVLNLELLKGGFPMVLFNVDDRDRYYEALRASDHGNAEEFLTYLKEMLADTLTSIIDLMDPEWLEVRSVATKA